MSSRKDSEKADSKLGVIPGGAGTPPAAPGAAPETTGEAGPFAEKPAAEQIAKLQSEKQDLLNSLIRLQADFENYRKRIERERHEQSQRAVAGLIEHLLPVFDAFDRAMAAHANPAYEEYRKGFELIQRHFWDVLAKQGVQRIEAAGKPFDPHEHHAVERVESNKYPDGTVIEELQAGYRLRDKILRPAMVKVAVQSGPAKVEGKSSVN